MDSPAAVPKQVTLDNGFRKVLLEPGQIWFVPSAHEHPVMIEGTAGDRSIPVLCVACGASPGNHLRFYFGDYHFLAQGSERRVAVGTGPRALERATALDLATAKYLKQVVGTPALAPPLRGVKMNSVILEQGQIWSVPTAHHHPVMIERIDHPDSVVVQCWGCGSDNLTRDLCIATNAFAHRDSERLIGESRQDLKDWTYARSPVYVETGRTSAAPPRPVAEQHRKHDFSISRGRGLYLLWFCSGCGRQARLDETRGFCQPVEEPLRRERIEKAIAVIQNEYDMRFAPSKQIRPTALARTHTLHEHIGGWNRRVPKGFK